MSISPNKDKFKMINQIYLSNATCKFRKLNPRFSQINNIETSRYNPINISIDLRSNNIHEIQDTEEKKEELSSSMPILIRDFSNRSLNLAEHLISKRIIQLNLNQSNSTSLGILVEKEDLKKLYQKDLIKESFENYSALEYLGNRWIGKRVPYYVSGNIKEQKSLNSTLESTIKEFSKESGIKFEKYLNEIELNGSDYVYFDCEVNLQSEKTQVTVGRHPGKNIIIIHSKSSKPVLLHVLMHIIGFAHQQIDEKGLIYGYLCKNNLRQPDNFNLSEKNYLLFNLNFEGPYDKYSVMHIPACEDMQTCLNKKIKLGVKSLSKIDKMKIKYLYGNKKCTKNYFKNPYMQSHYNCETCWGKSEIPICAFCAQYHHKGHKLKDVNYGNSAKPVECCCGVVGHISACSKLFKESFRIERFKCKTCSVYLKKDINVCYNCFIKCHNGHEQETCSELDQWISCSDCNCVEGLNQCCIQMKRLSK